MLLERQILFSLQLFTIKYGISGACIAMYRQEQIYSLLCVFIPHVMQQLFVCIMVLSQYGWTVVHFAAYNGHLEMLKELMENFNCEADKRDMVNSVVLQGVSWKY